MSGLALANNGPHGDYALLTDKCAGCHRAHTAVHASLLKGGPVYADFCFTCHKDGLGANTDAYNGKFTGGVTDWNTQTHGEANTGLNGGGFAKAFEYTGFSSRTTNQANVTSIHNALDDTTNYTAWGGGDGSGYTMTLTCVTCHDPHGSTNYRILKTDPNPGNGYIPETVTTNEDTIDYTITKYKSGESSWCADCHSQYYPLVYGGCISCHVPTPGPNGFTLVLNVKKHPVGHPNIGTEKANNMNNNIKLPVDQNTYNTTIQPDNTISCLTCHQAHGTSATMTGNATVAPTNDSALLRLNNRGVCQDCHLK
jgi:predicted CXXCH cytochrome family protein